MYKKRLSVILYLFVIVFSVSAQINTERVMAIGRNALYFEDYILSIQYFNQIIKVKPYLADPYFYRGIAKLSLDDFKGAEADCSLSIERNPFIINAYQVRGIARQNLENYKGAVEDYELGLKYEPENRTFLMNKAIAEVQMKNYDAAEKSFENLIRIHPSFYNGYLSRGQFYLEKGDTLKALKDIDQAIGLDKYLSSAYAQRAIVKLQFHDDKKGALSDMNEALRLDPDVTSYYINRALIRYHQNDLRGTMSDYDRALELEPSNLMARYNRGLLRAQVGDKNRAITDFSKVIEADPTNYFSYYNRAILRDETGDYRGAIKDYSEVLKEYPNFLPGYYARSEARRKSNDRKGAEADFSYAMKLEEDMLAIRKNNAKGGGQSPDDKNTASADDADNQSSDDKTRKESDKNIQKFNRILVADNNNVKSKYASAFRGRVQDKNVNVRIESPFVLTYYEKGDDIKRNLFYNKTLQEFNRAGLSKKMLLVTNDEVALNSDQVNEHFASIDDYSKQIENNPGNPLPYFGRALDFMLIQDFASSLEDLNRTISLSPKFTFAYFNRAVVRYKQIEYKQSEDVENTNTESLSSVSLKMVPDQNRSQLNLNAPILKQPDGRALEYELVVRDYDKVIELDPKSVYAFYNRANVRFAQKDYRAALADYNEAIRLEPEFAEAYYNRGLILVSQGETKKGIADLSKAGELGIVSAYNIIKRMSE